MNDIALEKLDNIVKEHLLNNWLLNDMPLEDKEKDAMITIIDFFSSREEMVKILHKLA